MAAASAQKNDKDILDELLEETLDTQKASADITGRAVAKLSQAELVGRENMVKLASQEEQLKKINQTLDGTKDQIKVAEKQVGFLGRLAKTPFFLPVFGEGSVAKAEEKLAAKTEARNSNSNASIPLGKDGKPLWAPRSTSWNDPERKDSRPNAQVTSSSNSSAATSRMVEGASSEQHAQSIAYEQKIESDLSALSSGLGRLKQMGAAIGQSLDRQDQLADDLGRKVDTANDGVNSLSNKLRKI